MDNLFVGIKQLVVIIMCNWGDYRISLGYDADTQRDTFD